MWVLLPSTSAEMTLPKADKERLILVASFKRSPCAPVLVCLSLPARSTRLSFPTRMWFSPSGPNSLHSMVMTKITESKVNTFGCSWEDAPRELRTATCPNFTSTETTLSKLAARSFSFMGRQRTTTLTDSELLLLDILMALAFLLASPNEFVVYFTVMVPPASEPAKHDAT
uniref:Uncharacterized protein n=1 Tax=Cyprinus carpio TaxID=7962 RepID=A0A8C1S4F0_CYPCA